MEHYSVEMRRPWVLFLTGTGILALSGCAEQPGYATNASTPPPAPSVNVIKPPSAAAAKIVAAAHQEVDEGALYTVGYFKIGYPNGDLPKNEGVCTDVVIRALRGAGYDLQKLLHEDIVRHFKSYPRREEHPDSNIDHRRVPNQMFFFKRFGTSLSLKTDARNRAAWEPGDIVYWKLDNGLDHAGVVSDTLGSSGLPMVIHNLQKCREEDVLATWRIQGHFRYPTRS
jgi:hypothetical protein